MSPQNSIHMYCSVKGLRSLQLQLTADCVVQISLEISFQESCLNVSRFRFNFQLQLWNSRCSKKVNCTHVLRLKYFSMIVIKDSRVITLHLWGLRQHGGHSLWTSSQCCDQAPWWAADGIHRHGVLWSQLNCQHANFTSLWKESFGVCVLFEFHEVIRKNFNICKATNISNVLLLVWMCYNLIHSNPLSFQILKIISLTVSGIRVWLMTHDNITVSGLEHNLTISV